MQDNNPLFKTILHLLGVNGVSYLILLVNSILIFRIVDKSHYGLYVIMLSLFAIVELLMAGFNDSITRFLKDKITLIEKQSIVLIVLCYKYFLIFSFIIIVLSLKQFGFIEFLIGNYDDVSHVVDSFLFITILNGCLSIFIGVNNCILNAHHKYKLTAKLGLFRNLAYMFVVILLSFFTKDYLDYLYSSLVLSTLVLLFLSIKINQNFSEFSISSLFRTKLEFNTGKKYILPYAMPLTFSSLLTYVKNHLPILILGKEFDLEDVAIFSILKTFFKALNSLSGSFVEPMMSKFLELKNNLEDFSKKLNEIFYSTLVFRLFSFILLSLGIKYFFMIYKIEVNEINQIIFYVLGIEYVIAGMILIYGTVLRLEANTNKVLIASVIRFVLELFLIYLILFDYGIIAAAIILLVARYVETITTYLFVKHQRIFKKTGFVLFTFTVPILFFLYKLSLTSY